MLNKEFDVLAIHSDITDSEDKDLHIYPSKIYVYTGCFTTLGHFLGLCDQKSSYKHVSDFGQSRSYDRFLISIHVLM